ncbi:MAG: hypothetical protein HYZ52_02110 [Candidatus Omnitrophica bacterium]|nr:hypothetical protein [Candidatus Omnitrophota bacterium]
MDFKKEFTAGQVAALVEDLKGEFRTVAEVVTTVHEDMMTVKEEMIEVKNRLTALEDAVRVAVPSLEKRLLKLEATKTK